MRHLCDTNVWIALTLSGHFHAPVARSWFDSLNEADSAVFCRATQQSFMRLLTTPGLTAQYGSPAFSNSAAWTLSEQFRGDPRVHCSDEPPGIELRWREYSARRSASPKLWMDAYLAAFAVSGGFTLVTTDAAFQQFAGLDLLVLGGAAARGE